MARPEGEEKPVTRYECEKCQLRTEVTAVKNWVSDIDKRQWWGITLAITNLIGIVVALAVIIFKMLPAVTATAAVVK